MVLRFENNKLLMIACFVMAMGVSNAQDVHFSQFFFSGLSLNPANTGNFDGEWRFVNNNRRQWGAISPYSTFAVGFDRQAYARKNHFSWGAVLLSDLTNQSSLFVNKFFLSGAYHKNISKQVISLGLQAGVVNKHLDMGKLAFPDQYDEVSGTFTNEMATFEPGFRANSMYFDANAGLMWTMDAGILQPRLGAAAFHVNMPKESFYSSNNTLPPRLVFHGGTKVKVSPKFYFTPDALYMSHNTAVEMIMGSSFTYVLSDNYLENSVFTGFYTRNEFKNFDALVIMIGGNYQHWTAALSYDLNMSELKTSAKNVGGFELSLIYREISTQIQKFFIPCERY